jgi:hypothetical protein
MMYQAIYEDEIKHHIRDLHREAEGRSVRSIARQAEADAGVRYLQQLQRFVGAIVLFLFALAAGTTATILDQTGQWVYWVLAIWAIVLVSRAIKLFAPEFVAVPQPDGCAA